VGNGEESRSISLATVLILDKVLYSTLDKYYLDKRMGRNLSFMTFLACFYSSEQDIFCEKEKGKASKGMGWEQSCL